MAPSGRAPGPTESRRWLTSKVVARTLIFQAHSSRASRPRDGGRSLASPTPNGLGDILIIDPVDDSQSIRRTIATIAADGVNAFPVDLVAALAADLVGAFPVGCASPVDAIDVFAADLVGNFPSSPTAAFPTDEVPIWLLLPRRWPVMVDS
jgi:hypothetical protein